VRRGEEEGERGRTLGGKGGKGAERRGGRQAERGEEGEKREEGEEVAVSGGGGGRSVGVGKEEKEEEVFGGDESFDFWVDKKTRFGRRKITFPLPASNQTNSLHYPPLPHSHPRLSPRSACILACSLLLSVLNLSLPLARLMADSTLFNLLWTARDGSLAEKSAALFAAIVHLQSLPPHDAGRQLLYQGAWGRGVLHLLASWRFSECEQAASFLSLVIERGRESCGTTVRTSLLDAGGRTALHTFARFCSDLSLTKVVLREHPPSLTLLTNYPYGRTPLNYAESIYGSTSENAVFLRAATAAFNASNFVALQTLCGGSSPYLSREIHRQATSLRAAVAISLNRQEAAPSALSSVETGIALSLLGRLRNFGRVGDSSDLLRVVLEFVGPYVRSCDAE